MPAPRSLAEAIAAIRAAAPDLEVHGAVAIDGGWDSLVVEVNGEWIFRFPRDESVEAVLRAEIPLLPALARALPVEVPELRYVSGGPVALGGYRKIDGLSFATVAAADGTAATAGTTFAAFLAALHAFPAGRAVAAGVPAATPETWRARHAALFDDFESRVVPLLPRERAAQGRAMLRSFLDDDRSFAFEPVLVHYDLGPAHLFFGRGGELTGVIDWSDVAIGDPAVDLAWALHATPPAFRAALLAAYPRADAALVARASFHHRLGPWHEVVHGLDLGDDHWVTTGLAGVVDRLPRGNRRFPGNV